MFSFQKRKSSQSGNIVLMLFAGIAMVGVLGVATTNFMQGPLRSAVKVTRQNTADTQMSIGGQVAIMAAINTANNGDCDNDGMVEPLEWLDAGALPKPVGGGLVPLNIGISKKDPWGTEYGYCVWDYGTQSLQSSCQTTPGTNRRLQGTINQAYPVVALVSAGPDKTFTTTCRHFSTGAARADQNNNGVLSDAGDFPLVGKANVNDDDIITTYTYLEAMAASGGLWTLKSNDPAKAVINKDLEVSGGATFSGTGTFARLAAAGSDFLEVVSGLKLASPTQMPTCTLANGGVMRLAADNKSLEICDGAAAPPKWTPLGAGGGATAGALMTVAATGTFTKAEVGDYDVYTFTDNGNFSVTELGTDGNDGKKLDYLVVAGGGGGTLAGGGAGGLLGGSITATVQSYNVVVGAGGAGGSQSPPSKGDGKDSSFAGLIAKGGGGGEDTNANSPHSGGSGGGGTYTQSGGNSFPAPGGAGTPGQGYAGCAGYQSGNTSAGGGGGGTGGNCGGQNGGAGVGSAITGLSLMYACGGGGSVVSNTSFSFGAGGCNPNGGSGTPVANRGHGAGLNGTGSAGIVIIKVRQRGVTAAGSVAWPLKAPDGGAATPSYSFTSLPTKGLYVDSGSVKLSGLSAPTANDQAANKAYVDTAVAAAAGGGSSVTYLGLTSTSYTGNLSGYMGANEKCRTQYGTGARMMRYQDIKNIDTHVATMGTGWLGCESQEILFTGTSSSNTVFKVCDGFLNQIGTYSNYSFDYADCGTWRMTTHWSGNTIYGFTYSKTATSEGMGASTACAASIPIHCVK